MSWKKNIEEYVGKQQTPLYNLMDDEAFVNTLTPEAKAVLTKPIDLGEDGVANWSTPVPAPDREVKIVYFGIRYECDENDRVPAETSKRLARVVNELVRRGLIEYGTLCPAMVMSMVATCKMCKGFYTTLSPRPVEEVHEGCITITGGTAPPPLQHHAMFLFYPGSRFTREELNKKLAEVKAQKHFTQEGEIPPTEWPFGI